MKKYLFAAAMLPVAFASCTQDAIESEVAPGNTPNAKGFDLELVAQKGDIDATRTFNPEDQTLHFNEGTEQLNMFWLSTTPPTGSFRQSFNSIFNIEKEDGEASVFKSKSMVYEGYNVATYPGQYKTTAGEIELTVDNKKDGIKNIPFISNLINFESCTANNATSGNLQAGFNNRLKVALKQAANYADIDMNFSKIATEVKYCDEGMKVQSIKFDAGQTTVEGEGSGPGTITGHKVFATKAGIQITPGEVYNKGQWSHMVGNTSCSHTPVVAQVKAAVVDNDKTQTLESTAISVNSNLNTSSTTTGKAYVMTFPTQTAVEGVAPEVNENASITVYTNMGYVEITTTKNAQNENTTPLYKKDEKGNIVGSVTVEDLFNVMSTYQIATKGENFKGEIVGKYMPRALNIDMSKAVLDGSIVYNSNDIVRYIDLYKKTGKDNNMTLVLASTFKGLNAEALADLNSSNKFFLDVKDCSNVILLGGGDVKAATPKASKLVKNGATLSGEVTFTLESGKDWTVEQTVDVQHGNATYNFINNGKLTLKHTDANTNAFKYNLTNNGTVQMDCNDFNMGVYTNNGTTEVDANKVLYLKGNAVNNEDKTINVATGAQLLVVGNIEFTNRGTINNSGFLAVQMNSGTNNGLIINTGIINVQAANAMTLISENQISDKKGTINLQARNNEVSVGASDKQGYIAIKTSKLGTNGVYKAQTGDKMNKLEVDEGSLAVDNNNNNIHYMTIEANASVTGTDVRLSELTVNSGKIMNINTGNKVVVTETTKIETGGKIVVGGTLRYGTCQQTNQIYTTGVEASVSATEPTQN